MADHNASREGGGWRNAVLDTRRGDPLAWGTLLFAFATAIAVADALVGDDIVLIPVLIVPLTISAARCVPKVVQALGAYCVGLAIVAGLFDDFFLSTDHIIRTSVVAAVAILAVYLARVRSEAERL